MWLQSENCDAAPEAIVPKMIRLMTEHGQLPISQKKRENSYADDDYSTL
jgi:hypothetical protein